MARGVSILLSVVLLICPTLCAVGRCCDGPACESKQRAAKPACCPKCAKAGEEGSRPAKGPESDPSRGSQCICHGAVVDHAPRPSVELELSWDLPAVVVPVFAVTSSSPLVVRHELLRPDIGKSPGRAVCVLFSTMQC